MASFTDRIHLDARFYVLPSAILIDAGGTRIVPMGIGAPALERMVEVDRLAERVAGGELTPEEGIAALDRIEAAPPRWPWWLRWMAPAVVSGAAVPLFGGGWAEVALGAAVALACSGVAMALKERRDAARLIDVLCGALAAILVHVVAVASGGAVAPHIAVLTGLIFLLPGSTLTTAFTELATRHWISGTAGVIGGTLTLLLLGFGVAAGEQLASQLLGPMPIGAPTPLPTAVILPAVALLGAAFTVELQARPKDALEIVLALAVALMGAWIGRYGLGNLGGAVGAFALTATSHALARYHDRPSAVTQVPGILILVPGSIGFRSVAALIEHDVMAGVEAGFATMLSAVGLVVGILLATAIVPPRGAL